MARRNNSTSSASRNMGIRNRLLLLLAVPLAGLLAVAGYAMVDAVGQSRDAAELTGGTRVALSAYHLVDALQAEREALAARRPVDPAMRSAVADAAAGLRSQAARQGGAIEQMANAALARVAATRDLARIDIGGLVAVDGFSPAVQAVLDVAGAGIDPHGVIDGRPATTTDLLANAQEAAAHERDLVAALSQRDGLVADQFGPVSLLASSQSIRAAQAAADAPRDLAVRIERIGDELAAAARGRNQIFFPDGAQGSAGEQDAAGQTTQAAVDQWIKAADARVSDLQTLRDAAAARMVAAVDALGASSWTVLLLAAAGVIAAVLISTFLVRSAIRSIARPLRELSTQAEELATRRLPDAVDSQQSGTGEVHLPTIRASGASEVQEVARAFNGVQDTALRLAGEQAVLRRNLADALTNLGRRNQVLLGRQLDFITSLEQRETDPDFLEHLFKLDHLASRMRRNAESLLILTGAETPRRRRTPAPLNEVVRAAMSEVEDFERVRLGHLGDATIIGPVVIDLVHMLAELIENALRFSPPDTTVEIDGRSLQGGYQLAVIDHGVGMADVELVAANHRLSGLDEVDGMPTRYLGQYVVARLATKTGALVRLQATAGGRGVTAVVSLPASTTVGGGDPSSIAMPLPGTRAAREVGPELFAPGAGLTTVPDQPDPVIDPTADPFTEQTPVTAELFEDPAVLATEDWGWTPRTTSTPVEQAPVAAATASTPSDVGAPFSPVAAAAPFSAEDFLAGAFAAEAFGAEPVEQPPPPPATAPDQSWEVVAAEAVAGPQLAEAPDSRTPVPETAAVRSAPSPAAGLTRRVPGASLQDSPLGAAPAAASAAADRSADGVRSMLSALQSGRSRGRTGPADGVDPEASAPASTDPFPVDPQAWPDSTTRPDEHPAVLSTPEMEEPRDH